MGNNKRNTYAAWYNLAAERRKEMTRKHILYTLVTSMALSAVIVIVSLAYSVKTQRAEAYRKSVESSVAETQEEIGFTLKEYNGELAVFRGSSETPYRLLGVSASVMSEYDRNQLRNGIFVRTEKELNTLIEDFTS